MKSKEVSPDAPIVNNSEIFEKDCCCEYVSFTRNWFVDNIEVHSMNNFIEIAKILKSFDIEEYIKEIESRNDPNYTPSEMVRKAWKTIPMITKSEADKKYGNNKDILNVINRFYEYRDAPDDIITPQAERG